jgi:hypothetical protein
LRSDFKLQAEQHSGANRDFLVLHFLPYYYDIYYKSQSFFCQANRIKTQEDEERDFIAFAAVRFDTKKSESRQLMD